MSNATPHQNYVQAREAARNLVERIREESFSDEQIMNDLLGLGDGTPPWRAEMLRLLAEANGIPLNVLCEVCNVGPAKVMARRRKDPQLDEAVRNYLGASFEDEAQVPLRDIKAGVLQTGLTSFAHGWKADEGRQLSDEDLHKVIRAIVDSVRLRVSDPEILKAIGQDIQDVLNRTQGK